MTYKDEYDIYYEELVNIVQELYKYYDIDKIKSYGVYVWKKEEELENPDDNENIFDIYADKIVFWTDDHYIIPEAMPIIEKIQNYILNNRKEEWFK